jgi:hypothetical protein
MDLLGQQLEERPTAERSPTQLGEAVGLSRATIWRHLRAPADVGQKAKWSSLMSWLRLGAHGLPEYGSFPE